MKPSETTLGQYLQIFLLRHGYQVEQLAAQMALSAEALSNLIHGRRRFRNETLARMAQTPMMRDAGLTLEKLKALRCVDEYSLQEVLLTLIERFRRGEAARLPDTFFQELRRELDQDGFPLAYQRHAHALLEVAQSGVPSA